MTRNARFNPFVLRHPVHNEIERHGRKISLSPLDCTGMSVERVSTLPQLLSSVSLSLALKVISHGN